MKYVDEFFHEMSDRVGQIDRNFADRSQNKLESGLKEKLYRH